MRRRTKISISPKYILIICTILCIMLIFISFRYSEKLEPIKNAIGTVLTPMQKGINTIGRGISSQFDRFASMNELLEENSRLKEEISTVTYENKILQQDKYELASLRKLMDLNDKYASYPKVAARVIGREPNNWYGLFTIDKGTNDGLSVDMNVMAGNGLVGIIIETGHNYSVVRPIIDDNSNVSAMSIKTSDPFFVEGDLQLIDKGLLRAEEIPKDAKIEDGDEIVTSHVSNKYLQGILIGYISDIKVDDSNMTRSGIITPAVDFKSIDIVLVITELKEAQY